LLSRLAVSDEAAKAFKRMKAKEDAGEAAIVDARQLVRTLVFLEQVRADNPKVAQAIEQQLSPKDHGQVVNGQAAIITACIMAEHLARTFPDRVKKAQKMLERGEQHRKAVTTLRGLLNEIITQLQQRPDPLWVRGLETRDDIEAMGLGLALFEKRIKVEEDVANINLFQLKASQKSHLASTRRKQARRKPAAKQEAPARRVAAIKLLAEEVKRVTGNAHYQDIADLAGVIFEMDVSQDQVRAAQRLRGGHWEWAVRSLPEKMRKLSKVARLHRK